MEFKEGHLYHLYNQGNNRQDIFFKHENYLYFLDKMKIHILPHCDILAYCLMPNHFHIMIRVNEIEILPQERYYQIFLRTANILRSVLNTYI
ncbi:MAG: transposase [Bacteroidales bacterium]|nr:transposase [Bacteroidales bacterium]